jgi:Na+/H+ antiporter NhaD/arsenite permease-like protein
MPSSRPTRRSAATERRREATAKLRARQAPDPKEAERLRHVRRLWVRMLVICVPVVVLVSVFASPMSLLPVGLAALLAAQSIYSLTRRIRRAEPRS